MKIRLNRPKSESPARDFRQVPNRAEDDMADIREEAAARKAIAKAPKEERPFLTLNEDGSTTDGSYGWEILGPVNFG